VAKWKTYGWMTFVRDPRNTNQHGQVRMICSARSKAEAARIFGRRVDWNYGGITFNSEEERVANARPLTLLWKDINDFSPEPEWFELKTESQ